MKLSENQTTVVSKVLRLLGNDVALGGSAALHLQGWLSRKPGDLDFTTKSLAKIEERLETLGHVRHMTDYSEMHRIVGQEPVEFLQLTIDGIKVDFFENDFQTTTHNVAGLGKINVVRPFDIMMEKARYMIAGIVGNACASDAALKHLADFQHIANEIYGIDTEDLPF